MSKLQDPKIADVAFIAIIELLDKLVLGSAGSSKLKNKLKAITKPHTKKLLSTNETLDDLVDNLSSDTYDFIENWINTRIK